MLFNKYQYNVAFVQNRGGKEKGIATDEQGNRFIVIWLLGVEKNSTKSKILSDKLRHIQKVPHSILPKIVEYGYDEERNAYAIVYESIDNCQSLDELISNCGANMALLGLADIADTLCSLHVKYNMSHGDLTPTNILVDNCGTVHLFDFGLADMVFSINKESELQVYDSDYAAPEKLSNVKNGFPYQSDIYSFGKILEYVCHKIHYSLSNESKLFLNEKILSVVPENRPSWKEVIDFMKQLQSSSISKNILTDINKLGSDNDYLSILNSSKTKFDVSPTEGNNIIVNIYTNKYSFNALWVIADKRLAILKVMPLEEGSKRNRTNSFDFDVHFGNNQSDDAIGEYFQKWYQKRKQEFRLLKRTREATKEKLDFYDELLDKEIQVIRNHSLKIQYSKYKVVGNEIHFSVVQNEKCTSLAGIYKHIENGNDVNADPIRYVLSANGEIGKDPVSFIGTPIYLDDENLDKDKNHYCFKIKDCQYFDKNKAPFAGFLMEDCEMKMQEKQRQKEAIRKVKNNDVQNADLIYYLFKPQDLNGLFIDYDDFELSVKQKGIEAYSYNQKKAIVNALQRTPLSVIQGPPGTGKTTVITEIVFQLLEQKPDSKILITSQTNNAVDQVLENLMKNNIPILRLSGLTEPRVEAIKKHTIKRKLSGWKELVTKNAKENLSKYQSRLDFNDLEELHNDWLNTISSIKEEGAINQRLVDSIRVIGATCNHIASKQYSKFNFEFDYIIMDESGKATIAESLVPIVLGNNLIFVGDHRQLRPMLTASREIENWLREKHKKEADEFEGFDEYFNRPSLFEDVICNIDDDYKTQLTECRRSSEKQIELTSKCFYEPEGDEPIKYVERAKEKEHNLPLAIAGSVFMIDIGSEYKNSGGHGESSYNEVSVEIIAELLNKLNKYEKVRDYSVGLITAYSAQYQRLRSKIRNWNLNNIRNWKSKQDEEKFTVSVIDRFQGLERDVVIVDLVKSGANLDLGFLETPNRINVGLSRQKKILLIVGDYYGLINAKTKRSNGDKCALQKYLAMIPKECVIKATELNTFFK